MNRMNALGYAQAIEARLAGKAFGTKEEIPLEQAHILKDSNGYEPSYGLYPGEHWRRRYGTGSFHLRIWDGRAFLHLDRFDPRRHPIQHALEVPEFWAAGALVLLIAVMGGSRAA